MKITQELTEIMLEKLQEKKLPAVGQRVQIIKQVTNAKCSWISPFMDEYIGYVGKVKDIRVNTGKTGYDSVRIEGCDNWNFPFESIEII